MAHEVLSVLGTMTRETGLALAAILTGEACAWHVRLPSLPEPHAPITLRLQAYQRLRPIAIREDTMQLENGLYVTRPEDLLPAVHPNSTTAHHALRFTEAQSRVDVWTGIAMGGLMVGVVTNGVGLARNPIRLRLFSDARPADDGDGPLLLVAGFIGLIAGTIGIIAAYTLRPRANAARAAAFRSYDAELRERLDFCGDPASIRYSADAGAQPDAIIP